MRSTSPEETLRKHWAARAHELVYSALTLLPEGVYIYIYKDVCNVYFGWFVFLSFIIWLSIAGVEYRRTVQSFVVSLWCAKGKPVAVLEKMGARQRGHPCPAQQSPFGREEFDKAAAPFHNTHSRFEEILKHMSGHLYSCCLTSKRLNHCGMLFLHSKSNYLSIHALSRKKNFARTGSNICMASDSIVLTIKKGISLASNCPVASHPTNPCLAWLMQRWKEEMTKLHEVTSNHMKLIKPYETIWIIWTHG